MSKQNSKNTKITPPEVHKSPRPETGKPTGKGPEPSKRGDQGKFGINRPPTRGKK